jgi:hypothetical protein
MSNRGTYEIQALSEKRTIRGVKTHDLMFVSCRMAYKFICGGWKDRRNGIRWTVDDVVEHFHQKHVIEIIEID